MPPVKHFSTRNLSTAASLCRSVSLTLGPLRPGIRARLQTMFLARNCQPFGSIPPDRPVGAEGDLPWLTAPRSEIRRKLLALAFRLEDDLAAGNLRSRLHSISYSLLYRCSLLHRRWPN